jgi:hypothetical protein
MTWIIGLSVSLAGSPRPSFLQCSAVRRHFSPMRRSKPFVRDPGEKYCSMYPYLWTVSPFQNLVKNHMALIEKFPNRKPEIAEEAGLTPHD